MDSLNISITQDMADLLCLAIIKKIDSNRVASEMISNDEAIAALGDENDKLNKLLDCVVKAYKKE